ATACFFYIIVRFSIRPDYPVLAYFLEGGERLRDIAFNYGIYDEIYIFRPSIVRQFTRIGVPLILFYSFILYKRRNISIINVLFIFAISLLLAFGTFKRTPLVY